jgi:hypothetical protein
MTDRFDPAILDRLRRARRVHIETRAAADRPVHRTVIWIVVDERDRVLVRSYRGAGARWFREAIGAGPTAIVAGSLGVSVRVERAFDDDRIGSCSEALGVKYAGDPAARAMVRDEVLDTTLELHRT